MFQPAQLSDLINYNCFGWPSWVSTRCSFFSIIATAPQVMVVDDSECSTVHYTFKGCLKCNGSDSMAAIFSLCFTLIELGMIAGGNRNKLVWTDFGMLILRKQLSSLRFHNAMEKHEISNESHVCHQFHSTSIHVREKIEVMHADIHLYTHNSFARSFITEWSILHETVYPVFCCEQGKRELHAIAITNGTQRICLMQSGESICLFLMAEKWARTDFG